MSGRWLIMCIGISQSAKDDGSPTPSKIESYEGKHKKGPQTAQDTIKNGHGQPAFDAAQK